MAGNNSDGGGRQRWTTAADDNGTQDRAVDYNGEGREQAENNDSISIRDGEDDVVFNMGQYI